MAEIIIQKVSGVSWRDINVSASVGRGGINKRDDVMVIQALMKYGLEGIDWFRGEIFPAPNGIADQGLIKKIERYQRYLRSTNRRVSVDGRIDPARGMRTGRNNNLMYTIQQLNSQAEGRCVMMYNDFKNLDRYIDDIRQKYPQVDAILSGTNVGTLNLGLE